MTNGDWDIKVGVDKAISEWITPIPASYNNQLISFTQDFAKSSFVLTNSNQSLTTQKLPGPGTDLAPHATFRLIQKESSTKHSTFSNAVGKSVVLEPFDLPGMNVIHQGADQPLVISSQVESSSIFLVVPGLDGRNETISLESQSHNGCYVYSGVSSAAEVKLSCKSDSDATFNQAASFVAWKGLRQYNPISFVAKGANRNFLLEPLLNFSDKGANMQD